MKTILKSISIAAIAAVIATSCEPENNEPITKTLTFEGSEWTALVDNPQYGGKLLYGEPTEDYSFTGTDYAWHDKGNTELASELCESYGAKIYWNGGHAVSNYVNQEATTDYNIQLAIPLATGNNGSKTFCVHNGHKNEYSPTTGYFYFKDGKERVIESLFVTNTSYYLGTVNPLATAADWTKIVATGYNAAGKETGTSEFYLTKDGKSVNEWTKWELGTLGAVAKVDFDIQSSIVNEYGMAAPAYFAYDDVTVR